MKNPLLIGLLAVVLCLTLQFTLAFLMPLVGGSRPRDFDDIILYFVIYLTLRDHNR